MVELKLENKSFDFKFITFYYSKLHLPPKILSIPVQQFVY